MYIFRGWEFFILFHPNEPFIVANSSCYCTFGYCCFCLMGGWCGEGLLSVLEQAKSILLFLWHITLSPFHILICGSQYFLSDLQFSPFIVALGVAVAFVSLVCWFRVCIILDYTGIYFPKFPVRCWLGLVCLVGLAKL